MLVNFVCISAECSEKMGTRVFCTFRRKELHCMYKYMHSGVQGVTKLYAMRNRICSKFSNENFLKILDCVSEVIVIFRNTGTSSFFVMTTHKFVSEFTKNKPKTVKGFSCEIKDIPSVPSPYHTYYRNLLHCL